MDARWLELLDRWNRMDEEADYRQTQGSLLAILRYLLEQWDEVNAADLDRVRMDLERTIEDREPEDLESYNLGMAKTLVHMMQYLIVSKHQLDLAETLPPLELKVIRCLGQTERSTPTQIALKLELPNRQQATNLLRSLRAKKLVSYVEHGKNHWYRLTTAGKKALQNSFRASEEQAVAADLAEKAAQQRESSSTTASKQKRDSILLSVSNFYASQEMMGDQGKSKPRYSSFDEVLKLQHRLLGEEGALASPDLRYQTDASDLEIWKVVELLGGHPWRR